VASAVCGERAIATAVAPLGPMRLPAAVRTGVAHITADIKVGEVRHAPQRVCEDCSALVPQVVV
jgi:hypothetical protein